MLALGQVFRIEIALLLISLSSLLQSGCSNSEIPSSDPVVTTVSAGIRSASASAADELWVSTRSGRLYHISSSGSVEERSSPADQIQSVFFLDGRLGWVLDSTGHMWRTDDGGRRWEGLSSVDGQVPNTASLSNITFLNRETGWLIDAFNVWTTQDGGRSWNRFYPVDRHSDSVTPAFGQPSVFSPVNSVMGWIGLTAGNVVRVTADGVGQSEIGGRDRDIRALFASDERRCWAGLWNSGGLFYTSTGGSKWDQMLSDEDKSKLGISSIFFVPQTSIGWLAGIRFDVDTRHPRELNGVLMKTVDGGKSWFSLDGEFNTEALRYIKFANNTDGWLVGESSVFRTSDGGDTWQKVFKAD